MVKADKKLNGAKVLVMGITFKENCPDMRNTKVVDIISELKEYECNVDVYDYWVDKSDRESKDLPFIDELPLNSHQYDAIIVAVAHDKFKELTEDDYRGLSRGEPIVIDVKGIVEKPTWRL
jgi:UDP-N-acetyl-D-galactosamine dehydrogenase